MLAVLARPAGRATRATTSQAGFTTAKHEERKEQQEPDGCRVQTTGAIQSAGDHGEHHDRKRQPRADAEVPAAHPDHLAA